MVDEFILYDKSNNIPLHMKDQNLYPGIEDKFAYFAVQLTLLSAMHCLVLAETGNENSILS